MWLPSYQIFICYRVGNASVYGYMHLKTLCWQKEVPILCKRRNYCFHCQCQKISGAAADFPALTSNKCTEGYKQDPLTVLLTHLGLSMGLKPPPADSPGPRRAQRERSARRLRRPPSGPDPARAAPPAPSPEPSAPAEPGRPHTGPSAAPSRGRAPGRAAPGPEGRPGRAAPAEPRLPALAHLATAGGGAATTAAPVPRPPLPPPPPARPGRRLLRP